MSANFSLKGVFDLTKEKALLQAEGKIKMMVSKNMLPFRLYLVCVIVFWCVLFYYLYDLKRNNCKCSGTNTQRDVLTALTIIFIVNAGILFIKPSLLNNQIYSILGKFFLIVGIIYIVLLISYVRKLEDSSCNCLTTNTILSNTTIGGVKVIKYLSYTALFAYVLSIISFIFIGIRN